MSQSIFNREIRRAITGSFGRFMAIFAIVALGVGFFAGLMMTAPDMNRAADAYYDETNLMDIRVVSTMGLTDDDVTALREVEGVDAASGAYETDVIAEIEGDPYVVRVHSLWESADGGDGADAGAEHPLNDLDLAEGRLPERANECVISADRIMNTPVSIGDRLVVTQGSTDLDEVLAQTTYEIVGLVHSSYYVSSTTMGSTSLGSGRIQQFMYVLPVSFSADYPYTEVYLSVEGAQALDSSSDDYDALVGEVMGRIEAIAPARVQARFTQLKDDAQSELDDARRDFEAERADAERELADAQAQLDDALAEITTSEGDLDRAERDYQTGRDSLDAQRSAAEAQLSQAREEIARQGETLEAARTDLQNKRAEYEASASLLPPEQAAAIEQELAAAQAQLDAGSAQLDQAQQQLDAQATDAHAQLDAASAQLASARAAIDDGRSRLSQGRADYEQGVADYREARAEADEEFAKAERELADAQADIDAIEQPEWLVMDRTKNYGAESFSQDAERIHSIAQVFPLIFFLVAALVALTTMTRMVEEERMLIGTHKALGYGRMRISSKYLIYALVASLGGSIVGIAVLSFVLPVIIMHAYAIVYIVPIGHIGIDWLIAIGATALGVGITLVATWAAVASTLRESPAALMLPRAPKPGKRILLERIRPLWSRLSFLWKVTCRNIFRYKRRMVMTTVGIAGCTALLLTGFGLYDSINDIIDLHYGQIVKYNTTVILDDEATQEDADAVDALLAESGEVTAQATASRHNVVALRDDVEYAVPIVVPTDIASYERLHVMRERLGHAPLALTDDGALITEKLGTLLGVGVGDTFEASEPDSMGNPTGERVSIKVSGLLENYVENGIYMSKGYYEQVFGKPPLPDSEAGYNMVLVDSALDEEGRASLADASSDLEAVKTLSYNDETIDSYRTSLNSVNTIVYVLIAAAALLAFIVLYNLTNINITERVREIATLKVLGFTRREVRRYIFREIVILAILGALVGLVLGVFIENFVVVTAEVDAAMFGRVIHPTSFVLAFALTMLFTWFVTLFMRRKLDHIDMVESLKSNE